MRFASRDLRRVALALFAALAVAVGLLAAPPPVADAHELDHGPSGFTEAAPPGPAVNSGGEGVEWELVSTIPTGNLHSDLDFFTQKGITYASVGTLAVGVNAGGQTIIQLTNEAGEVEPSFVAGHPSASCVSDPTAALGLQHDVEATPKGDGILNTTNPHADRSDTELLIDATDYYGRCHDQGTAGTPLDAPYGGLEIIDVTDIANPVEIGLTTHTGEAHTTNVDPKRPHIVYSVTSDAVSVAVDTNDLDKDGDVEERIRQNEPGGSDPDDLDGFEIADISSCFPSNMTGLDGLEGDELTAAKREQCRPQVWRYRYPTLEMSLGHSLYNSVYGCHELEIYPDDRLTCGSGAALISLDMSGVFDDNGTPDDYTDDKVKGTPMPCRLRESSTTTPGFTTGAMVTDCREGGTEEAPQALDVASWIEAGKPGSVEENVTWLGSIYHQGRAATNQVPPTTSAEDIDFNHEAELTHSGRFLLATDERGGGVAPPGATCAVGNPNPYGNGGIHAYPVDGLSKEYPAGETPEERRAKAWEAYAVNTEGEKSIFRAPVRTGGNASICTAHVFQQIPDQNRIFMGWYSQGTQVLDYVELPGNQFEWIETGYFIPENANEWVSHIFKYEENEDGTWTYWGATGDFNVGAGGRNAIDIYKVTMPKPADVCTLAEQSEVTDRDQARETHRESVDCVLHYDIARGTSDTTYSPLNDVTREQMASFVVNALEAAGAGDTLPASGGADEFSDIRNSKHRDNINRLASAGIIRGTGDGRFSPGKLISREQMATFMVAAARFATDAEYAATADHFADVTAANPHRENINGGFEAGLFSGTKAPEEGKPASGLFSPEVQVKRDQMATFLIRLFSASMQ